MFIGGSLPIGEILYAWPILRNRRLKDDRYTERIGTKKTIVTEQRVRRPPPEFLPPPSPSTDGKGIGTRRLARSTD